MKEAIDEMLLNYGVWQHTLDNSNFPDDQKARLDAMINEIGMKIFDDVFSVSVDRDMRWIKVSLKDQTLLFANGSMVSIPPST